MTYVSTELRHIVFERADGCCEYCHIGQEDSDIGFHVEHIIAVSHRGKTTVDNLALSCAQCNRFKGSDVAAADPETGDPTFLFHPRRQQWADHFRLNGAYIAPITPEGRVTVFLLRFNIQERVAERELLIKLKRYPC